MKLSNSSNGARQALAALAGLAFALTAAAQPEQWLEYHTGTEPKGYRWLELSTNPPPNVALPKLEPGALFGCWSNALDKTAGRWFCLDRIAKRGPCDRLFFDRNGNGRLDDETPVKCTKREERESYFEPVKLVFKGVDGPISYHLIGRFYQFEKQRAQLLIGAGGWYEGNVNLAGKKRRVQLVDNTVNGVFNDQGRNPSDCDRLIIMDGKEDRESGRREVARYLGKYLEVDGQLLQIEVAGDGAFLKVKKAEGVKFGTVRVPENISEFVAFGKNGHFVRKPEKGQLSLPVGEYRINDWTINRKDEKGGSWTLSGRSFTKAGDFTVTAEATEELKIGEPVRALLQANESKGGAAFSLRLLGQLGESVEIMRGSDRPRAPRLQVASLQGTFRSTNTFEYG
jgi:hypothetical protein